jgi:DNA-binding NarL/FixJ family response regulator
MYVSPAGGITRVGLVSDEPIRVLGIVSAFEDHRSILIANGEFEALLADSSLKYLILDLSCSENWLDCQLNVSRSRPDVRQIVIGPNSQDSCIMRSIGSGSRAYLHPGSGPLAIRQAVEAVIEGVIWAPRRLLTQLIDRLIAEKAAYISVLIPEFSPRERQVLNLMLNACSNREIAMELGIEERTVKSYVASLMRKTGVDNRVALSMRALQDKASERRLMTS